jgi:adenylate cyclase
MGLPSISAQVLLRSRTVAAIVASVAVFLIVWWLRSAGALQPLELATYDWNIRLQPQPARPSPPVALLTITEQDILNQGRWPISNDTLATVLEQLDAHSPRAIGVDIYLDVEVPPGREKLDEILLTHPRIVAAMKFPQVDRPGIPPPPVLADSQRVGFTDMLADPGGIVRRGFLFMDDGVSVYFSLALRLALLYLQEEGVAPQADPDHPTFMRLGDTTFFPFESDNGGYAGADAGGYQFLLDYRDQPEAFATISLTDFLAGNYDPSMIEGKVVLIGVTAESVKDEFFTPFSGSSRHPQQIYGVALHGQIVNQLLRAALDGEAPYRVMQEDHELYWILLWSLLGGVLGLLVHSVWRFAAATIAGAATIAFVGHQLFIDGWWIPVVPPMIAWIASASLVTAYISGRERRERTQLMRLFSSHISPQLASDIWEHREEFADGGHPRPQRITATVLFSDIVGFTTVSEGLAPAALMDWLDDYMSVMTPVVNDHGGVILRFIGDAIMAVFGIPVPRASDEEIRRDAVACVDCALAMQEALAEHNRKLETEGLPTIGMRIGILTGPMISGDLGSADRREYNVHGDTVNTASRIEGFDKETFVPDHLEQPCRILIGDATHELLGDAYEFEFLKEARLRGKAKKIGIYRVLGRGTSIAGKERAREAAAQVHERR